MRKTFFTSDLHFFHRAILSFSPSRIGILGLDQKYSPFEIQHNHRMLKDVSLSRDTRNSVKAFFVELVADMNDAIVERWNDKIALTDDVYILGDVSFGKFDETEDILRKLNGRLFLVRGNHDYGVEKSTRFEWQRDYKRIKCNGCDLIMFHYPIKEWDSMQYGAFHLHGHVHGDPTGLVGRVMDVGIEAINDVAISFEDVYKQLIDKPVMSHHGKIADNE